MPAQGGQMLGEMGGLQPGLGQQVADRRLAVRGCGQQFQHPDPGRVGQGLEKVGLDFVQGGLCR